MGTDKNPLENMDPKRKIETMIKLPQYTMKDLFREINDNLNQIIWEILDLYLLFTPAFKGNVDPNDNLNKIAKEVRKEISKREREFVEGLDLGYVIHSERNNEISLKLTTNFLKEYLELSRKYKRKYVFGFRDKKSLSITLTKKPIKK